MANELLERSDADLAQAFLKPEAGQVPAVQQGSTIIEQRPVGAQKLAVLRDEARVLQKIKALAAAAGTDWFYRFPVRKKGGGQDFITGPSIKLANNIARLYGNCDIDVRLVDNGATWWIYAKFIDLETGFAMVRPFQQDKGAARLGGVGPEADARRLDIALQIGVSKAIRNVIVNALEIHCDYAFEEAQKNLVGRIGANLADYRTRAIKWFADNGVAIARVERAMGRASKDWLAPDLARLAAETKAVEDGMATIDETWPLEAPPEPRRNDIEQPATPAPQATPATSADASPNVDPPTGGGASAVGAGAPPPPAKVWRISDNVIGQNEIIRAVHELVGIAESDADLQEIRQQNAHRITKWSAAKQVELNRLMTDRSVALTPVDRR